MPKRLTPQQKAARTRAKNKAKAARLAYSKYLAEKAEREKGRKSLKGLDPRGWMASLDQVIDGLVDCPLVSAVPEVGQEESVYIGYLNRHFPHPYEKFDSGSGRASFGERVAWVRVLHCPERFHKEMRAAFGCKFIWIETYKGKRRGMFATPIYPVRQVVTLFAAIWPENWQTMAAKYLDGYTSRMALAIGCDEHTGLSCVVS